VLLISPRALLEEAEALRNWLRSRLPVMKTRRAQLWSVRIKATGRRVAVIELRYDDGRWRHLESAGWFNRAAPSWVPAFAESLALSKKLCRRRQGAQPLEVAQTGRTG